MPRRMTVVTCYAFKFSHSNHLYCVYMNEVSPTPFGVTTEKSQSSGSRRLSLSRQNNAEFDGEEDYCCKGPKNNSVIATWAVDHRCKSDFTVITQITSAAVYSAVHCISRLIPCGLEVFAQRLLKLFAGRVEGTVFNLCSFVVAISSHWETRVIVFSKLAVRWTVNGKRFSLTACVA